VGKVVLIRPLLEFTYLAVNIYVILINKPFLPSGYNDSLGLIVKKKPNRANKVEFKRPDLTILRMFDYAET
jgi:hypothetical protein